jgi:altronate dehydratase
MNTPASPRTIRLHASDNIVVAVDPALQCGGSDGCSGITANPALGAAVDLPVRHGGTAILSQTPEIHGDEHLLVRRAESPVRPPRLTPGADAK